MVTKKTKKEEPVEPVKEEPVNEDVPVSEETQEKTDEELVEVPGEDIEVQEEVDTPLSAMDSWNPQTLLGKNVKSGKVTSIDEILERGEKILEVEIVDALLPNLKTELLLVGQAKGKFGGGQKRVFKQTQKKTREGNKPKFTTFAVVGDENGHIGIGRGKAKETVPAREKAIRKAKLNIIKIRRGSGSWKAAKAEPNSIPFKVSGKSGSVILTLIPAPKGTGLRVEKECQKMLELAGVKDVWSQVKGQTKTKQNLVMACFNALKKLTKIKVRESDKEKLAIVEGSMEA